MRFKKKYVMVIPVPNCLVHGKITQGIPHGQDEGTAETGFAMAEPSAVTHPDGLTMTYSQFQVVVEKTTLTLSNAAVTQLIFFQESAAEDVARLQNMIVALMSDRKRRVAPTVVPTVAPEATNATTDSTNAATEAIRSARDCFSRTQVALRFAGADMVLLSSMHAGMCPQENV